MAGRPSLKPEEIVEARQRAQELFEKKYMNNQSAFARDLGIQQTAIRRFLMVPNAGLSTATFTRLNKLFSAYQKGAPTPVQDTAQRVQVRRAPTTLPPSMMGSELNKAIDFFEGRWHPITISTARAAEEMRLVDLHRQEWPKALDDLNEMVTVWLENFSPNEKTPTQDDLSGGEPPILAAV